MPQFVEIPAPVITTTFFDFDKASAISCSCGPQLEETFVVGIALFPRHMQIVRDMPSESCSRRGCIDALADCPVDAT
jgi:hypothetical protein